MQATTNVYVKESSRQKKPRLSRFVKANEPMDIPDELVDLIKEDDEHPSYSGGILAGVVICILLGLIALVTYLTMPDADNNENLMPVYFSDIFKINLLIAPFEYAWKDGHLVFRNGSGHFYSTTSSSNTTTISHILSNQNYFRGMSVSFDLSIWLIPSLKRKNENLEDEFMYTLLSQTRDSSFSRAIVFGRERTSYISAISWGPRSNYLVAVYKKNIYYSLNPITSPTFICISCHMDSRQIYGLLLGYYKEKIFNSNNAFWWHKSGGSLAFLSLGEGNDKKVNVEIYELNSQSPKYLNISYAQAGSSPSMYKVEIHIIVLATQKLYSLNMDHYAPFLPYYIVNVQWFNGSFLLVSIISADQNHAALLLCEIVKLDCFTILEKASLNWIDTEEYQNILIDDKNGIIYIGLSVSSGSKRRRHLAKIKVKYGQKNMITWFNLGVHNIVKLNYFDNILRCIYYLATDTAQGKNRLYRVNIDTSKTECASCSFTPCYRNEFHFSDVNSMFLHRCLGPAPETYQLVQPIGNIFQTFNLEMNEDLKKYIKSKSLSKIEYASTDSNDNSWKDRIMMKIFHPRHLNPNHVIQYPALLIISDSAKKETMNDDFSVGWIDYLTSYLNYVVIQLDVVGTRDHRFLFQTSPSNNQKKGKIDFVKTTIKKLITSRLYIDNSSIGVIGENYGGYLAMRFMSDDNPDIRCGATVNPIVNFGSYDAFLSERYIGPYSQHQTQYKNSQLRAFSTVEKKEFLLVHDSNQNDVLFENSVKFMKNLIENEILFDFLLLYQKKDSNTNWNQNKYALRKITKFFVNCFNRSSAQYSILEDDALHSS